jgi:hypothetical protein
MKKMELGQTITILANLSVIAGIVFLAYEIRQNSESLRAQTRTDITANSGSIIEMGSPPALLLESHPGQ